MKRTAIAIVAAAALAVAAGSAVAKEWTKIRIGVEGAYPPFSWVEPDGTLKGFDIEIAEALCAELKAECTLVAQDWDGIIPALLSKKFDAIVASMSITEERKQKVDFTGKYYHTPAKMIRKKGSGIEATKDGMKGKTVAVQRATTHDSFITAEFGDTAEIKRYGTQDEAYLDAQAGRVDILLADSVALSDGFLKKSEGADWEFFGPDYVDPKYFGDGAGIAVRKEDPELRDALSKAIQAVRDNGTYKRINDKYFEFDIYGG